MLDFPNAPTVGQKFPQPPVTGVPVYTWDGTKWTTIGGNVGSAGSVRYDLVQGLNTTQQAQGRSNIGINQAIALAVGTDFNTVQTPGTYYTSDNTCTNLPPVGGFYWYLEVMTAPVLSSGDIMQRATHLGIYTIWVRTMNNGTWQPWKQFLDTSAQTLTSETAPYGTVLSQRAQVRTNIYAAPFDAMGWSGMQVNGSMDVSQRGTSAVTGGYIVDGGWQISVTAAAAVVSASQSFNPSLFPGFSNLLRFAVTTAQAAMGATDFCVAYAPIEGNRIARLAWGTANAQPLTIGFWTDHVRTGLYSVAVRNGAANRSYVTTYNQNASAVPQFNVVTIPGDVTGTWTVDNSVGFYVLFAQACGTTYTVAAINTWTTGNFFAAPGQVNSIGATSDIFRITGLIVLPGIEAPSAARSPFIMRPYNEELLLCQRYLYVWNTDAGNSGQIAGAYVFATNTAVSTVVFPVPMRAAPTISLSAPGDFQVSGQAVTSINIGTSRAPYSQGQYNWGVASGLVVGQAVGVAAVAATARFIASAQQ